MKMKTKPIRAVVFSKGSVERKIYIFECVYQKKVITNKQLNHILKTLRKAKTKQTPK
jgi:hypothetical protein